VYANKIISKKIKIGDLTPFFYNIKFGYTYPRQKVVPPSNFHTIFPEWVTSQYPKSPSHISVFPLGNLYAPDILPKNKSGSV
jgi:hypothetical protein